MLSESFHHSLLPRRGRWIVLCFGSMLSSGTSIETTEVLDGVSDSPPRLQPSVLQGSSRLVDESGVAPDAVEPLAARAAGAGPRSVRGGR